MGSLFVSVQKVKWCLLAIFGMCFLAYPVSAILASTAYTMKDFQSMPISIVQDSSIPQVQINASNDHQLYFKAYNDYGDLDDDGQAETTYKHSIDYYGYFDNYKCYSYSTANKRFEPKRLSDDKYCTPGADEWSGNFLNWGTMTRIDAIRKILFGGHRRVDTKASTVLERAFIPPDIHAFAKYYNRTDLPKLTPFKAGVIEKMENSSSELSIGFGTKVFKTANASVWNRIGDYIEAFAGGNSENFIAGSVLAIDAVNGEIIVNVTSIGGSGTFGNWDFYNKTIDPVTKTSATSMTIATGTGKTFVFADNPSGWSAVGDYVEITSKADKNNYMRGWITGIDDSTKSLKVNVTGKGGVGNYNDWGITNLTRTGITLCNVTYASGTVFSEYVTDANPPLIRVADGNYAFWAAGEVHQCLWEDEDLGNNGKNYNNPEYSNIAAAQDNPFKAVGLGEKDYVAKVEACVDLNGDGKYDDANDGRETCKQYKNGNFKPIGLLQEYGDSDELLFGMIAGTYGKSTRGGDMVMPLFFKDNGANNMCREINLGRDCDNDGTVDDLIDADHAEGDGTFKKVYNFVGGPVDSGDAGGVINTWSIYRIKGYQYGYWNYNSNSGDKCPHSINFFGDSSTSECQNWGNPFAEIYLTALRHWVGENAPTDYQANDKDKGVFLGLNYLNGVWEDPLTEDNYCAPLSIINFNSSVISTDTAFVKNQDELDSSNQGIVKDLDSPFSSIELTRDIGDAEKISELGTKWFIGETKSDGSKVCTAKTVTNFGEVRGLCPEGPGLSGGYLIAGMAWYAHTNDIRPESLKSGHALKGIQTVDNYSVRLASGNPIIDIPVPESDSKKVTIIPSCINNNKSNYGCTLVDFKIITSHYTEQVGGTLTGKGKFLAIWEDSLQGNDYDLDAGGVYEYEITSSHIKVTTAVTLQNLADKIGHGYVISGTTQDGLHIHSGTNGFGYTDTTVGGCSNCKNSDGPTSKVYTLGTSEGKQLEDPLWYAAKWGGFVDKNDNKMPDLVEEWDSKINKTGENGSDGIPDNYFLASHPQQLEDSLRATFDAILERTSSGTAAAVVSSNVRGEGALYQAFYEPLKKQDGKEARWIGTLQALWLDSFGHTRQDCTYPRGYDVNSKTCIAPVGTCVPDGILDNYCVDQVVETFYDEVEERARVKVFNSTDPDMFEAFSMQGVVSSYASGGVVMAPNSLQGLATYNTTTYAMELSPYYMKGTVTSYEGTTGTVTLKVADDGWSGPVGESSAQWEVNKLDPLITGRSSQTIVFASNDALVFDVDPVGDWINVGEVLTLTTKKPVGRLGESFDNWDVNCLAGSAATGKVVNRTISLRNRENDMFIIDPVTGDFDGCTMAQISTYDLKGKTGESFNDWSVVNVDTIYGRGESHSTLTLSNSGTKNLIVTPNIDWLFPGNRLSVSNYTFDVIELNELGYLWNAREELYHDTLSEAALKSNRDYNGAPADNGRFITTWVDLDLNGDIDTGEYRAFEADMFTTVPDTVNYGYFDVASIAEGEAVVNYVRGIEVDKSRNRKIRYGSNDISEHVMRLGDIINSTPTVAAAPQEAFNLLYNDQTYKKFRRQYQDRRVVVYTGGNDGLLHAFNGGFYDVAQVNGKDTAQYSVAGKDPETGAPAIQHPLGSELWAYAPYNLLSHLQWLKDPNYALSHVYYVDGKPRIFDANIFDADTTHPDGWGTILVVGMNLGGGKMAIDTDSANVGVDTTLRSAYVVFDITNPETPPALLGEIKIPDESFTTVYPAVLAFRDAEKDSNGISCNDSSSNCVNKWYLQFGTGPDNMVSYASSQTAKMYLFDLAQLTTESTAFSYTTVPTGCAALSLTASSNILSCDTNVASTFIGTPVVVDYNLDFHADTSYYGLVGDADADTGELWRMTFSDFNVATKDDWEVKNWYAPALFFKTNQPVFAQPVPAFDDEDNKWVFFGTGRYFADADKISLTEQTLYGIKDRDLGVEVLVDDLLDVTDTEVYTDRSTTNAPSPISTNTLSTFDDIEEEIDLFADGWKLDLPPISGSAGIAPATRNFTRAALLGGVLFTSVFQPSEDPCVGEGLSRLYGLYYKTGTGFPGPAILGTSAESVNGELKYRSLRFLDLGIGVATAPAIHSGAGKGGEQVTVFTQQSTGDIVKGEGTIVDSVRTGKTSWKDR